jgi:hypothetical protein
MTNTVAAARFRDNSSGDLKDGDSMFLTCNVRWQTPENVAKSLSGTCA